MVVDDVGRIGKTFGRMSLRRARAPVSDNPSTTLPRKVAFLVRSLEVGGAEKQLVVLARGLKKRGNAVMVITYYPQGELKKDLLDAGVEVICLNKRGRWETIGFFKRLVSEIHKKRPDDLLCFMSVANVLGVLVGLFVPGVRVIWGIRSGDDRLNYRRRVDRFVTLIESRLSSKAAVILANSSSGRAFAIERGFPSERTHVVPNGIDTDRFCFDPDGRERVRRELGLPKGAILIGLVARLDPVKDHPTFLKAAKSLSEARAECRFFCVGGGSVEYGAQVRNLAHTLGLDGKMIWWGSRDDMPDIYSAIDLYTSSSFNEGFSNSIAEAMACSRMCVVTDVGDSAMIVGECGLVVRPRDSEDLRQAWLRCLDMDCAEMGRRARERILDNFSMESLLRKTEGFL